jgi:two-component system LytT family response regulator
MNKIKCMVIDDEPLAVQLLESYINRTDFLELVATSDNPISASKILEKNPEVQLLFLDIQMPELSGIDFSATLSSDIRIIFTTAFSEYAISGYKVNALDYLLKPFNYEEFLLAAQKAQNWFDLIGNKSEAESSDQLFIKSGYQTVQIRLSDVLYFQGFKDYIKIYLESQSAPILTLMTMKKMTSSLPDDRFIRIHRSYIVPISKIVSADKDTVKMVSGAKLPISDSYKEELQKVIESRTIRKNG